MISLPDYSVIPDRALEAMANFIPDNERIDQRTAHFSYVEPRAPDQEGGVEILDGVEFTHRFVDAPGDSEFIRWHYVEAGSGEPIVFLHGIPDSWYQWHHQMASLSKNHRCIAVDLKGYGQSDKTAGDYGYAGVSEQLFAMLEQIGLKQFNLVTHDRGSVLGDYITANHPDKVLRYGRGEQHLYHFHPDLAPQGDIFMNAPWTGIMEDPKRFVMWVYTWVTKLPIADDEMARTIQEFSYTGITRAVPRYFNASTFRKEWLDRRSRLLDAWKCPVMIMQGYDSKTQPREFYADARKYLPNARDVAVSYMAGGHFWTMESPTQTTEAIRKLLAM